MSALESLTEVFGEGGHGDNSEQFARELLDEHRVEVLAADGQAYDGELAMYRGLVRTLRVTARYGTDMREVQQLLNAHTADDAAARHNAGEEATADAAPATPDFFEAGHTYQHGPWSFRCDTVTSHPGDESRTALGWFRFRDDRWRAFSAPAALYEDGWTDVTNTTQGDST